MPKFTADHRETVENLVQDLLLTDEGRVALRALLADRDLLAEAFDKDTDGDHWRSTEDYQRAVDYGLEQCKRADKAEAEVERLAHLATTEENRARDAEEGDAWGYEMARRLRKLEMWSVHRRVTEYGEQELINEVRRILDGEE